MNAQSKYIEFQESEPSSSGKTRVWIVFVKGGFGQLGVIKWFGRWRCYGFFPNAETVYERACLRDLANFCERQTADHRKHSTKPVSS